MNYYEHLMIEIQNNIIDKYHLKIIQAKHQININNDPIKIQHYQNKINKYTEEIEHVELMRYIENDYSVRPIHDKIRILEDMKQHIPIKILKTITNVYRLLLHAKHVYDLYRLADIALPDWFYQKYNHCFNLKH